MAQSTLDDLLGLGEGAPPSSALDALLGDDEEPEAPQLLDFLSGDEPGAFVGADCWQR